ncbi:MAG: ParB/RepB/Spo0J family partition protein [Flammeovirgaceae bacterium TMED290]|nr:MAG: ParB/RepB/Spo0J family partition protein [Flammeovirgaceae bacterium TMED290]|tara:strand:- start:6296 stop:7141 length:846 start_codon:yes stop_codon:yes gene_type:complete
MVNKRNTLGRGLGSLINDDNQKNNLFKEININDIEINQDQPRKNFNDKSLKELAISIKNYGIIQPITVRRLSEKKFQLISGERRFKASKLSGIKTIPSFIKDANEKEILELALIENIQREDLNSIEISVSYKKLLDDLKISQDELAEKVGKDRSTINNYLRLLKLPPTIQNGIIENKIHMGHARSLITIEKSETQIEIYNTIINRGLSVRKTEDLIRSLNQIKKNNKTYLKSKEIEKLEGKLSSHFGTKIFTSGDNNKGKIIIPYNSTSDLNRILEILDII